MPTSTKVVIILVLALAAYYLYTKSRGVTPPPFMPGPVMPPTPFGPGPVIPPTANDETRETRGWRSYKNDGAPGSAGDWQAKYDEQTQNIEDAMKARANFRRYGQGERTDYRGGSRKVVDCKIGL